MKLKLKIKYQIRGMGNLYRKFPEFCAIESMLEVIFAEKGVFKFNGGKL